MRRLALTALALVLFLFVPGGAFSSAFANETVFELNSNQKDGRDMLEYDLSLSPSTTSLNVAMSSFSPTVAASSTAAGTVTYGYDDNGNLLSNGESCYTYNDANQLSAVQNCSTGDLISEYLYDHTGQRVVERLYEGGQLVDTVYTVGKRYETHVVDGSREDTSYYRANEELIARKNPDDSISFYHSDHLGSVTALTDEAGAVVEETRYYPYGAVREGGTASRYLYTGQESDPETDLYYYRSRFYDPRIRRFTQPDFVTPDLYDSQQLNPYSYVRNNPVVFVDPTGMWGVAHEGGFYLGPVSGGLSLSVEDLSFWHLSKPVNYQPHEVLNSLLQGTANAWLPYGGDIRLTVVGGPSFSGDESLQSLKSIGIYGQTSVFVQAEDLPKLGSLLDSEFTSHAGLTLPFVFLSVSPEVFAGEQSAGVGLGLDASTGSPPAYFSLSKNFGSVSLLELQQIIVALTGDDQE